MPSPEDLTPQLWRAVTAFLQWHRTTGGKSYDPYDIWGTRYGLFSRRIYYRNSLLGLPLIAPILLLELFCPAARSFFAHQQRFATADGQIILGLLNLYRVSRQPEYLERAIAVSRDLLACSIPGFSGHCWGYPFDWQNLKGLWKKNTPFITSTPYAFEAFLGLYDATGNKEYLEVAASAARFVSEDLRDTETGSDAAAGSYGPFDNSQVINASAYRAFVLFEAADRFGIEAYRHKAIRNLNFILQSQRPDGSWLYALNNPGEAFIDHFHTCFVLKNLFKISRILKAPRQESDKAESTINQLHMAIHPGWKYYRQALFDSQDDPKSFAVQPRTQIARLEMYNVAEAITLGALLRDEIPEAFALAQSLARKLINQYQLPAGHFVTRVFLGGLRHTFPFLRWPQAQLFYGLTNLLIALEGANKEGFPARSLPA